MDPDPSIEPPARQRTLFERFQALEPEVLAQAGVTLEDLEAELRASGVPFDEDGYPILDGLEDD